MFWRHYGHISGTAGDKVVIFCTPWLYQVLGLRCQITSTNVIIFVLACTSWQDFKWNSASRGLSASVIPAIVEVVELCWRFSPYVIVCILIVFPFRVLWPRFEKCHMSDSPHAQNFSVFSFSLHVQGRTFYERSDDVTAWKNSLYEN